MKDPVTSAIRSTGSQPALNRCTYPSSPTGAITRFATFRPATKFRCDVSAFSVSSLVLPTEMWPGPVVLVAVTLRTTEPTPAGTLAAPATFSATELRAPTLAFAAPRPERVSSSRVGSCDVNSVPSVTNLSSFTASTPLAACFTVTLTSYEPTAAYVCVMFRASPRKPARAAEYWSVVPSPQETTTSTSASSQVETLDRRSIECAVGVVALR